jgi:hypothetical protein
VQHRFMFAQIFKGTVHLSHNDSHPDE